VRKQKAERRQGEARGLIFVISGPSGSGKTTLAQALVKDKRLAPRLAKSISVTTRPRRAGERQGRDYFFLGRKEFLKKRRVKKILEWTRYLGYYYGTPREFVERKLALGKSMVFCLDSRGVAQLKKIYPEQLRTIFVIPPSLAELEQRIIRRSPKIARDEIKKRLRLAQRELSLAGRYDFRIINTRFSQALKDLKKIVIEELSA
jgi:guanylate kinase